jgi:hypothetical protein
MGPGGGAGIPPPQIIEKIEIEERKEICFNGFNVETQL